MLPFLLLCIKLLMLALQEVREFLVVNLAITILVSLFDQSLDIG